MCRGARGGMMCGIGEDGERLDRSVGLYCCPEMFRSKPCKLVRIIDLIAMSENSSAKLLD